VGWHAKGQWLPWLPRGAAGGILRLHPGSAAGGSILPALGPAAPVDPRCLGSALSVRRLPPPPMPRSSSTAKPSRPAGSAANAGGTSLPSPRVVKLQILAGVFVPMLALGLWLRSQGFW
jgi:hypothetical protein